MSVPCSFACTREHLGDHNRVDCVHQCLVTVNKHVAVQLIFLRYVLRCLRATKTYFQCQRLLFFKNWKLVTHTAKLNAAKPIGKPVN